MVCYVWSSKTIAQVIALQHLFDGNLKQYQILNPNIKNALDKAVVSLVVTI